MVAHDSGVEPQVVCHDLTDLFQRKKIVAGSLGGRRRMKSYVGRKHTLCYVYIHASPGAIRL